MGSASMMYESDYRRDIERRQKAHPLIRPRPVKRPGGDRRGTLPKNRIAKSPDPETRYPADVFSTTGVAAQRELIDVSVPDPVDGAFDSAPYLDRSTGRTWRLHLKPPAAPRR